jgi:hypothetical protein
MNLHWVLFLACFYTAVSAQTVAISPKFEYAGQFSEGLADVKVNGKPAYIDRTGKIVLDMRNFDYVYPFSDGLARVIKGKKFGYIDKTGKVLIKPKFASANDFFDGRAIVTFKDSWLFWSSDHGIIDNKGGFVVNPYVSIIFNFQEDFAVANFGIPGQPTVGVFNKNGDIVIPAKYEYSYGFREGVAATLSKDGWGFLDKDGSWVFEKRFDALGNFSEGLAVFGDCEGKLQKPYEVKQPNCKFGYLNKEGNTAIPAQFNFVSSFKESRAIVSFNYTSKDRNLFFVPNEKFSFGFINEKGKLVIDPVFAEVSSFHSGIAAAAKINDNKKKTWGYIDKSGNELTPFIYSFAGDVSDGLARIQESSGKWGYLSFK